LLEDERWTHDEFMSAAPHDAATAGAGPVSPVMALGPSLSIISARTAGVRLFARCPPVHSVIVGRCRLQLGDSIQTPRTIAIPANTPHVLLAMEGPQACVAYLDPRRYRFEDAQRLADLWCGFVPGRDDVCEAFGDALHAPQRRVDTRLLRVLDALDADGLSVEAAAQRVGLSASRVTHLMTGTLGAAPRTWRAWFKLRRAIAETLLHSANLTEAAHRAGFADSAHLTRTCKQLTGVRPAQMLPRGAQVSTIG
jgi:AraC-like DNA-binding protein